MLGAVTAIAVCLAALVILLIILRRDRLSLGLPVAYMVLLLLNHVPGAYAYVTTRGVYGGTPVLTGIALTAVGAACFTLGVWLVRKVFPPGHIRLRQTEFHANNRRFWLFCLIGGWILIYGLTPLAAVPSLGAAIEQGGAVWLLGVMMGLAYAFHRKDVTAILLWTLAMAVYPVLMLVLGGFLTYGSAAVIVVCSLLAITTRSFTRVIAAMAMGSFAAITIFVNYFGVRAELRQAVWGGASMDARLEIVFRTMREATLFTANNPLHLTALDRRLNQNYFVGVAAERLESGYVDYLRGESVIQGFIALVPRALWPSKPVYGGSPEIVARMTGLNLNTTTSWGVGNVMEFHINFGLPGVVVGFLLLGAAIGALDHRAATSIRDGALGRSILFFLPGVALIQPIGSMVELAGGAAAALVAAVFWRWAWNAWMRRGRVQAAQARPLPVRR